MDPISADICIEDIAHALACVNRFTGHLKEPVSVAQHSIHVSRMCVQFPLHGLLHDASEAYLSDIARPVKTQLPDYQEIEHRLQHLIYVRFGLSPQMPDEVKHADDACLRQEAEWGFCSPPEWAQVFPADGWPFRSAMGWEEAEHVFLARFYQLVAGGV